MNYDNKQIVNCRYCKRVLGEKKYDAQAFRMGENAEVFNRTRIYCKCGRSFMWIPSAIPDDNVLTEQQQELANTVRIRLAKSKNTETDYDDENIISISKTECQDFKD